METLQLNFSYNWNNKLDCKAFTTLRLYNAVKHVPGTPVRITLKGDEKGRGHIAAVKPLRLAQINDYIGYLDTGYNGAETKKILSNMYPNSNWEVMMLVLILIVKD